MSRDSISDFVLSITTSNVVWKEDIKNDEEEVLGAGDPHDGWCKGGRLNAVPYPIGQCFLLTYAQYPELTTSLISHLFGLFGGQRSKRVPSRPIPKHF